MSTTSTPTAAPRLSGIFLPAGSEQPALRIDARDPQEVHALVGGQLEMLACRAHRDVHVYNDAIGLAAGRPVNDRATRVFCPSHPFRNWIAGDVVIVGFDTAAVRPRDLTTAPTAQKQGAATRGMSRSPRNAWCGRRSASGMSPGRPASSAGFMRVWPGRPRRRTRAATPGRGGLGRPVPDRHDRRVHQEAARRVRRARSRRPARQVPAVRP